MIVEVLAILADGEALSNACIVGGVRADGRGDP
jgi:hypothetical protein